MKWSRKLWLAIGLSAIAALVLRAEWIPGADDAQAGSTLEAALFRIMGLPDGIVVHSRPPWEARQHVATLIDKTPQDAGLYSLRAREEELIQDYRDAEVDWKTAADKTGNKIGGLSDLADFYQRRNLPKPEIAALVQMQSFEKALSVAQNAQLPAADVGRIYLAWIHSDLKNASLYQRYFAWLISQENLAAAQAFAIRMKAAFPGDQDLAISADAKLAEAKGGPGAALVVYGRNFSALWPDNLLGEYYSALSDAQQLRSFLSAAQKQAAEEPTDLGPAERLYFYYKEENRKEVAQQQLWGVEERRSAAHAGWTATDLKKWATLFERVDDYDDAAHSYYEMYDSATAKAGDKEFALGSLIQLLLTVPEQPLGVGNRDLSLYRNIGRMDPHPGFLNGILSFALNDTSPEQQYQSASQAATPYFHRATASVLLGKMERAYPRSRRLPELQAELYRAYGTYGQNQAIARYAPSWMQRNQASPVYVEMAFLLANAYKANGNTKAELALYDALLAELATKSGHMPIGQAAQAQSPDYLRILNQYVARLVELGRKVDAVALLTREIDRNPDDPGLYDRLAAFLEQNRLDDQLQQTYAKALAKFKDASWASKLARFYLRAKRYTDYEALTRQVTDTFHGSELEVFLGEVPPNSEELALRINLYAHQRFPHNLTFVKNLLMAYQREDTADAQAYDKLLRENWFYDTDLRRQFFEHLSAAGGLRAELAKLPSLEQSTKDSNLAALELSAYGRAWLTDFESAAPDFAKLAELVPGDRDANANAIAIERSLSAANPAAFDAAVKFAEQDVQAAPSDQEAVTRVGEIYADREMYAQARPWWDRIPVIQPGQADSYLNAATVFWDYFQFGDALRVIGKARIELKDPDKFRYEAGAIYENQGDTAKAIASYIDGAVNQGSDEARRRLLTLAGRKDTAKLVDAATASEVKGEFDADAVSLRLDVLEKEDRRSEIEVFLAGEVARASSTSDLDGLRADAERLRFDNIAANAMQRVVEISSDPIQKLQAQMAVGHFYDNHNDTAGAEHVFADALSANPDRLGVLRGAVDFYWRNKQSAKAVQTLADAAERAQPAYRVELRREAAEKAIESGEYEVGRKLLDQLLGDDPWNGDLLAEKAETYAKQDDQAGLVAFYASELDQMKNAPLAAADKTTRLAALRRGYAGALSAIGKYGDALEQYQLIVNAYPEDQALIADVSRFASDHELADRLVGYYGKAVSDAPRDYRWPIVLARIDTALRRYPEAVEAYEKASVVRPDRADIFEAKADLQKRLLRFDDAIKTYQKLYELSYHDAQFLVSQAEMNMRSGRAPEAVQLLRRAYIDGSIHPAEGYVSVMQQEAEWQSFAVVDQLFREARSLLVKDDSSMRQAITLEAKALTALHRPQDAIEMAAASAPDPSGADAAANQIGQAVRTYLTPPEKVEYSAFLENGRVPPNFSRVELAKRAGLAEVEARLEYQADEQDATRSWNELSALQNSRLEFEEFGRESEGLAAARSAFDEKDALLFSAFGAYTKAGDSEAQMRLLQYAGSEFPELFVRQADGQLSIEMAKLAGGRWANQVMQYLLENGSEQQVDEGIDSIGRRQTRLWTNSYLALAGLYFLSEKPATLRAFDAVLGPRTVAGELDNTNHQASLQGKDWFYYAARYGEYLSYRGLPGADDVLSASTERNAAASDNYVQLANRYVEMKQPDEAEQQFRNALQLSPGRADVYDDLAMLAMQGNRRSEAMAFWRKAFSVLTERIEKGPLPATYWPSARRLLLHMNQDRLVSELKPSADNLLRTYLRRNGTYRFEEIAEGLFEKSPDPEGAVAWLVTLAQSPKVRGLLGEMETAAAIPDKDRGPLYLADIEQLRRELAGDPTASDSRESLQSAQLRYARYLEGQKRWTDEWAVLQQVPKENRPADSFLMAGAGTGRLDEILAGYRASPESKPDTQILLGVAAKLKDAGEDSAALAVREFAYAQDLQTGAAPASSWFGLAEVRFEQKRTGDGLDLIRGVTLTVGAPFENLSESVRVLEQSKLAAQAAEYAKQWVTAEPWNNEARLTLARLTGDQKLLEEIRTSPDATYDERVRAAELLRQYGASQPGTTELDLLTHNKVSVSEAEQPRFIAARMAAAEPASLPERVRLYSEVISLDPEQQRARLLLAHAALLAQNDRLGLEAFDFYKAANDHDASAEFMTVEELAGRAAERRGEYARAETLFQSVLAATNDPAQRVGIKKEWTEAAHRRQLRLDNAKRVPRVTGVVSQAEVVKPRLGDWTPELDASEPETSAEEEQQ